MSSIRAVILRPENEAGERISHLLERQLNQAGAEILKRDDFTLGKSWVDPVMEGIRRADLVFCDVSTLNGNIYYELGIAHALNKKTILLRNRNSQDNLPSDLQGFLYWTYHPEWPENLQDIVFKAVAEAVKHKENGNG